LFTLKTGRLQRSRIPNEGYLRADKLSTIDFNLDRTDTRPLIDEWRTTKPQTFVGMRYREADSDALKALAKAPPGGMVQTLGAWASAWQSLRSIDHNTRDIHLFTPSRYPLAHWDYGVNEGGGTPYAIENTLAGLDQPGEWHFAPATGRISLLTAPDDLAADTLVAANLSRLMNIDGANNLTFKGVTFAHTNDVLGSYHPHRDWPKAMRAFDPTFPETFPPGSSQAQAAPSCGEAIVVSNSRNVRFENCTFRDTGSWALRFAVNTHDSVVARSTFTQLGAGALNIDPGSRNIKEEMFPSKNRIEDCRVTYGGVIHAAAVGIRVAEAIDTHILHNEVAHFGYSLISIGWNWNPNPNHTIGTVLKGNDVHHAMKSISDGSAIYAIGVVKGTRIEENYIHDVVRAETAIGAGNSGIFFDQYGKGATVTRNVLRRIHSWKTVDERKPHPIKHHKNTPEDHTFEDNDVDPGQAPVRLGEVVSRAGPR
jgi:hypothetical protein